MKRMITLCRLMAVMIAVVAARPSMAQPSVEPGAESKRLDPEVLAKANHAGTYNGMMCVVAKGMKGIDNVDKKAYAVILIDHNMEPLAALELPQSDDLRLLDTRVNGQTLGALFVEEGSDATTVFAAQVDLATMTLGSGTPAMAQVERFPHGKKDRCMVWGAASPDGAHFGLVTILEYKDKKQYLAMAMMLDATMQAEWRKEYAMGSMEQLWTTNNGQLVSIGHDYYDGENHVTFNVADSRRADSYDAVLKCDPFIQLRIANVVGRHVVALGTFRPTGTDPDDNLCGGVVALSFNTDSGMVSNFTMHPFVHEDVAILLNRHTKRHTPTTQVDMVSVGGMTALPYGAALALGRSYRHSHSEANGVPSYRFCKDGLHIVAVDSLARIQFVRNLRRYDVQSSSNSLLRTGLFAWGDTLCVAKSEHRRYPSAYDIAKPAKEMEAGSKSNLVLYTIAPDGEVGKHLLEAKTRQAFLDIWPDIDGGWVLLSRRGNRVRAAKISKK